MNCELCSLPIEGQATAAVPCCQRIYHSLCLVKEGCKAGYNLLSVRCGCNAFLFNEPYQLYSTHQQGSQIDSTEAVNIFLATEGHREELNKLKEKYVAVKKARSSVTTILREKRRQYNIAVKVHADAIKALKKETRDSMRATEEWKDASKKIRSYTASINKFKQKHKLPDQYIYTLLGVNRYRYRDSAPYLLRRLVRVRV